MPLISQDFKENETNKEKSDKERIQAPSDGAGGGGGLTKDEITGGFGAALVWLLLLP